MTLGYDPLYQPVLSVWHFQGSRHLSAISCRAGEPVPAVFVQLFVVTPERLCSVGLVRLRSVGFVKFFVVCTLVLYAHGKKLKKVLKRGLYLTAEGIVRIFQYLCLQGTSCANPPLQLEFQITSNYNVFFYFHNVMN